VSGDGSYVAGAFPDGTEDVKIDCCLESRGALMRLQHLEDYSRGQRSFRVIRRLHDEPPWFISFVELPVWGRWSSGEGSLATHAR
jgi:hypothetical protein